jgi:hypothetical protein
VKGILWYETRTMSGETISVVKSFPHCIASANSGPLVLCFAKTKGFSELPTFPLPCLIIQMPLHSTFLTGTNYFIYIFLRQD